MISNQEALKNLQFHVSDSKFLQKHQNINQNHIFGSRFYNEKWQLSTNLAKTVLFETAFSRALSLDKQRKIHKYSTFSTIFWSCVIRENSFCHIYIFLENI